MRARQAGLSLVALIVVLFIIVMVALFGMKVVPSYIEYRSAKKAIDAIVVEKQGASPGDIRRAFDSRAVIDDIESVKSSDLEITKDGSALVIGFAYRREVPLLSNVGLYIDYRARAGGQ
jgi:Domain of unknown function (DUF4845)